MSEKLFKRLMCAVVVIVCVLMVVSIPHEAKRKREAKQQIYHDGYNAGQTGIAIECPWSSWYTEQRVDWTRGYTAGAAAKKANR